KNVTWELVPLPHGKKMIRCSWIYTMKLNADGFIKRYKARLVAKLPRNLYPNSQDQHYQSPTISSNKSRLATTLDLGALNYFLGIEVARSKIDIFLSQMKYVMDLLTETGMLGCKPTDTPIEMNHKLCEDMDPVLTNKEQYQCLVGRLIYLAHTRPDIAYIVSVVNQFMHSRSVSRWNAIDRILRYLKSAPENGLMFSKNGNLEVVGYTDVDSAGSITDRLSTSSYFIFVGGNLVTWRSKKKKMFSQSKEEAEYKGMAQEVCELLWIRGLLTAWVLNQKSQWSYIVITSQLSILLVIQFNMIELNML
ncbi:HXXXD-type acyl-transferase family protein, partial [Prunus dulcis]